MLKSLDAMQPKFNSNESIKQQLLVNAMAIIVKKSYKVKKIPKIKSISIKKNQSLIHPSCALLVNIAITTHVMNSKVSH